MRSLLLLIITLTLSGCVIHKVEQKEGLVGDLFRSDAETMLPHDIRQMAEERRALYEEIQDVDFVVIRENCDTPADVYECALQRRWRATRENRENEILLEEVRELICSEKKTAENCKEIEEYYCLIRGYHPRFMEEGRQLLKDIDQYRPSIIEDYIST